MELKVRAAHDQREASAEDVAALTGAQQTATSSPPAACPECVMMHDICETFHLLRLNQRQTHPRAMTHSWPTCADTMHVSRVAREDAERQLAADRATAEGMRADWQRKLEERRKEVGSIVSPNDVPSVQAVAN